MEQGLKVERISKVFPGTKALDNVDLHVSYGKVTVLVGENGAGKSVLMKVLSGVYQPDGGQMWLDGESYHPTGPTEATERGIVLIHQELSLLPNLSVEENIFLGRQPMRGLAIDRKTMRREATTLLEQVGLEVDPSTLAGKLSVAVQQQVEIAKALSQKPRLLIFDEATASLGDDETEMLYRIVSKLKSDNVGIVWITHRLIEIPRVGDNLVVFRDGQLVHSWDHINVPESEIIMAMVGRSLESIFKVPHEPADRTLLEVQGFSQAPYFESINFSLRAGEILGIAGLVGSGRTRLARALAGASIAGAGTVSLNGKTIRIRSPRDAVGAGIVLVPEDRKDQGVAQVMTVQDNLMVPSLYSMGPLLRFGLMKNVAKSLAEKLKVKGHLHQVTATLSGGNQQKIVIAKWLPLNPKVLIFDEPTRGIDVGARASVYETIRGLAESGVGIIVISSELPEVLGLSNRILVMNKGRQTGILDRSKATEHAVMTLAVR